MAGTAAGFPSRHGGPVGTHRSHGHPIGKGAELDRLLAELMGRETGVNQGKGGSMHLSDFSIGSLGETSIVGSGIPVAAGAALGSKMQGDDRVTLCFFGDGASNQGTFHEALNLAAIWSLPVVYVCENNAYGELTAASYAVAVENVSSRAVAYGMPGATVDGQDVLAVYEAVNERCPAPAGAAGDTINGVANRHVYQSSWSCGVTSTATCRHAHVTRWHVTCTVGGPGRRRGRVGPWVRRILIRSSMR